MIYKQLKTTDVDNLINIKRRCYISNYVNPTYKATLEDIDNLDWKGNVSQEIEALIKDSQRVYTLGSYLENGNIVGFGMIVNEGGKYQLRNIFVDPDHQGLGIGTAIVKKLLKSTNLNNDVVLKTTVAQDFYKKFGFEVTPKDSQKMILRNKKPLKG